MDFFSKFDFEYFDSVKKIKIKRADPKGASIGEYLKQSSVFAKTNYWAQQIAHKGFSMDMSWHWQNSGHVRHYTWAKIQLPGYEDSKVFFTVGVGSRFSDDNIVVNTLEYKLDCLRKNESKGLSPSQINDFDSFLSKNYPEAIRNVISEEEIDRYSWEMLISETLKFIDQHTFCYKEAVEIVWPQGIGVEQKIARICWNNNRWEAPSGELGKSKSHADTLEKNKGYGYEEWLFDLDKTISGFHYSFIQAFHKGNHHGKAYNVMLYSIFYDNNIKQTKYYWIGNIKKVYVLTDVEKAEVLNTYRLNGWLDEMRATLNKIGIDDFNEEYIGLSDIFNIRFDAGDDNFIYFDKPQEILNPSTEIGNNKHYVLLPQLAVSSCKHLINGKYKFKEGHNLTKTGTINAQLTQSEYKKSLKHKKMQYDIYKQLSNEYVGTEKKVGTEIPTGYGTVIDLVVSCPDEGDTFYEIKTCNTALKCIREALGQLFEYSYYPLSQNARKLIIVSVHPVNESIISYIRHLRNVTSIGIYYQAFDEIACLLVESPV